MRPTISQVRSWNLQALSGAAFADAKEGLDSHLVAMHSGVYGAMDHWTGRAAQAALARSERDLEYGKAISDTFGRVAETIDRGVAEMLCLRDHLLAAIEAAEADGYMVSDDGRVSRA